MIPSKILKLLKLTASSNDHEALSAIRMANSHLLSSNLGWDNFSSGPASNFTAISNMVDTVSRHSFKTGNQTIRNISAKWRSKSSLREDELETLFSYYKSCVLGPSTK